MQCARWAEKQMWFCVLGDAWPQSQSYCACSSKTEINRVTSSLPLCLKGYFLSSGTLEFVLCLIFVSSLSVYYVVVRTIVLSRHGRSLARPVIIHDIIHGLIYVPSTPFCGFFFVGGGGFAGWKLRLRPLRFFYVQLKVSQTSHLIYVVL